MCVPAPNYFSNNLHLDEEDDQFDLVSSGDDAETEGVLYLKSTKEWAEIFKKNKARQGNGGKHIHHLLTMLGFVPIVTTQLRG